MGHVSEVVFHCDCVCVHVSVCKSFGKEAEQEGKNEHSGRNACMACYTQDKDHNTSRKFFL